MPRVPSGCSLPPASSLEERGLDHGALKGMAMTVSRDCPQLESCKGEAKRGILGGGSGSGQLDAFAKLVR